MPIPFTVIGGFLGAGKTSLLNHYLRQHKGHRTAVLVNDFGALNIDAGLIAEQHGDTIALTNGCVCCNLGDDLSQALIRVLGTDPPFEAVIVEASGVSDPGRIAKLAQAAPELQRDAVVVLIDASTFLTQSNDPLLADTLQRQLQAADLLVLNKTDLVERDTLAQLHAHLASRAPGVPVLETRQGQVPVALLGGGLPLSGSASACGCSPSAAPCCPHSHHAGHDAGLHLHSSQFEAWNGHPAQDMPLSSWRTRLEGLPAGVLRLKGLVRSADQGWTEVQMVGPRLQLRRAHQAPIDGQATLVAIGLHGQLPREALTACCLS